MSELIVGLSWGDVMGLAGVGRQWIQSSCDRLRRRKCSDVCCKCVFELAAMGFVCDRRLHVEVAKMSRRCMLVESSAKNYFRPAVSLRSSSQQRVVGVGSKHGIACWSDRNVKVGRLVMVS